MTDIIDKGKEALIEHFGDPVNNIAESSVKGQMGTIPLAALYTEFVPPKQLETQPEPSPKEEPTYWDVFKAKTELQGFSDYRNAAMNIIQMTSERQPGYNPLKDPLVEARGPEFAIRYGDSLATSFNPENTATMLQTIDTNEKLRQVASNVGFLPSLAMDIGIGLANPTNWIPLGFFAGVSNFAARATMTATATGGIAYAQSELSRKTDPTISETDAQMAGLTGMVLGGFLVGASAAAQNVTGAFYKTGEAMIDPKALGDAVGRSSIGADAVKMADDLKPHIDTVDMSGYGSAKTNFIYNAISDVTSFMSPEQRAQKSTLATHKYMVHMFNNSNLYTQRNVAGLVNDVPLEAQAIVAHEANWSNVETALDTLYGSYKKNGGKMNPGTFNRMAYVAANKAEATADPYVNQMAKAWRDFFNTTADDASKVNLLKVTGETPEETAKIAEKMNTYVHRQWDPAKLLKDPEQLLRDIKDEITLKFPDIDPDDLKEASLGMRNTLMDISTRTNHTPSFRSDLETAGLKARKMDLSADFFDKYGTSDIMSSAAKYSRQMQKMITMRKFVGEDGDSYHIIEKRLEDEAHKKIGAISVSNATEAEKNALIKQVNLDLTTAKSDIRPLLDIYHEKYDVIDSTTKKIAKGATQFEYLTKMGMQTISNLGDVPRALLPHFSKTELAQELSNLSEGVFKGIKLTSKRDLKFLGLLDETFSPNSRLQALGDIIDDGSVYTTNYGQKANRALTFGTKVMGSVNLMNVFQNKIKGAAVEDAMTGILTYASKLDRGATISKRMLMEMNQMGVTPEMAAKALEQFKKYSYKAENGTLLSGLDMWDKDAKLPIMAIIRNNLNGDRVILPGGANKPLFMSSVYGRLIQQFQGFAYASFNRGLLSGLQRAYGLGGEIAARQYGLWFSEMVMGSLIGYTKDTLAGREGATEFTPQRAAYNAVVNMSSIALLGNYAQMADRLGGMGIGSLLGINQSGNSGKFAYKSIPETMVSIVGGPAAGHLTSVLETMAHLKSGKMSAHDLRVGLSVIPFNNLLWYNWFWAQTLQDMKNNGRGSPGYKGY